MRDGGGQRERSSENLFCRNVTYLFSDDLPYTCLHAFFTTNLPP
ncbi:hypothetical protein HMPREF1051_2702 [Neisseria sicca VK64]|uniref:Uncharacterized protein n=1 Tax=Neisseria sicca VK64 TaxID=1095748 RepID=I2NWC9_NEISI|nr:hypothetical protein HMPREF1051_2702 [Neisseria sicca VK64]